MPIRINLLAEAQAAEELRRKDPIKRALLVGAGVVMLTLLWIGMNQLKVSAARSEMNDYEQQVERLEFKYKAVKSNEAALAEANHKIASLERYSTNRFFWGTLLNALQSTMVDKVRLTEIRSEHRYMVTEPTPVFTTNIFFPYIEQPPGWKIWASPIPVPSFDTLVSNQWKTITNAKAFTTNFFRFTMKITPAFTNVFDKTVRTQVDFNTVPSATELISVEIRGRDYSTPYGAAIDELANKINTHEFFQTKLGGRGASFTVERPPQPQRDMGNVSDPSLFVPFDIEMKLADRILDND